MRIAKWLLFLSTTFLCLFHLSGCGQSSSQSKSLAQRLKAPPIKSTTLPLRGNEATSLQFSPDGKLLALGYQMPFQVELWDTQDWTRQNIMEPEKEFFGIDTDLAFAPIAPHTLAFLNASGIYTGDTTYSDLYPLFDLPTPKAEPLLSLHVQWSPDSQLLAIGQNRNITLTDARTGLTAGQLTAPGYIDAMAFTPDGNSLVVGSSNESVNLYDVKSGKLLRNLQTDNDEFAIDTVLAVSRQGLVAVPAPLSLSLAQREILKDTSARVAYFASKDQPIRLWNTKTGKLQRSLKGHSVTRALAFSPDGSVLATGSIDRSLRFWNVQSGKEITAIKPDPKQPDEGVIRAIAFSPDGNTVATLTSDSVVKVWKVSER